MGRRRIEITKEMLANVENMAGRGATKKQIALALGISQSTLERREKDNADFEGAIKKGKAKGVIAFSGHLYKQSQAGKTAATIFALINLAPDVWKQRQPEGVDQDTPPPQRVEIVMVDGRKDDQTED